MKDQPKSEAMETPYFKLSRNEYGKAWLLYKPLKDEPGRYSCWEPITEEFWVEFEKLQAAQEEITRLKAELERKNDAFRDGWISKHKSLTEELERERELRKEILKGLQRLDRLYYAGYTIYPNDLKPLIEKAKDL